VHFLSDSFAHNCHWNYLLIALRQERANSRLTEMAIIRYTTYINFDENNLSDQFNSLDFAAEIATVVMMPQNGGSGG
jgi:hypothetical protein